MPFEKFDKKRLKLKDLNEREHDLDLSVMQDTSVAPGLFKSEKIDQLVTSIRKARRK